LIQAVAVAVVVQMAEEEEQRKAEAGEVQMAEAAVRPHRLRTPKQSP
jgi:hypothetical protein